MLDPLFADIAARGWTVISISQISQRSWEVKLWDGGDFRCGSGKSLTEALEWAIVAEPIEPRFFAPLTEVIKESVDLIAVLGLKPKIERRF